MRPARDAKGQLVPPAAGEYLVTEGEMAEMFFEVANWVLPADELTKADGKDVELEISRWLDRKAYEKEQDEQD